MAKSYQAGVATLGIKLAYGVETVAGVKPEVFNVLHRISEIGDINLTAETIDASALEDLVERSVAGRASTGGTWDVTVNATDDTMSEWKTLINAYKALSGGKRMWFEIIVPGLTDADFIVAMHNHGDEILSELKELRARTLELLKENSIEVEKRILLHNELNKLKEK